jgi:3-hydroxyisobutyrate dehydrogenase
MGANVIHVGAVGSGEAAKLCNNLIAGVAAVAVSEAFRIAEGFGVDPKVLTDVISNVLGNTWVMQQAHPVPGLVPRAASSRDYAPGFMTDLMAKDLGLAVNAARELRIPVIVAPAAQQALRLASSHGLDGRLHRDLYVPQAVQQRRACLDGGPEMAPNPRATRPGGAVAPRRTW